MLFFLHGHATHPDWRMALALALAQVEALREKRGVPADALSLGWVYIGPAYAPHAEDLLNALRQPWPDVSWVGGVGAGVLATGVEYADEPAVVLMVCTLPRASFRLFSGRQPLGFFEPNTMQVHADGQTQDLPELLSDLSERTASGYLFGGLSAGRGPGLHMAGEVLHGGLSGVAFASQVTLISRVTQGCLPMGRVRTVTEAVENVVYTLDGEPALDCLLQDLGASAAAVSGTDVRQVLPKLRTTLVGLNDAGDDSLERPGQFGTDTRVRHLIGLEPSRRGLALADTATDGMQLTFCQRNPEAARRDLVRICAEIREEVEAGAQPPADAQGPGKYEIRPIRMAGAIYVSCAGRGGAHFGGPSAELQIVRHALGDVPLVGFFAGGEIAHHHLYGYTGVLTVFLDTDA